jgi:hypothetical protein
MTTAEIKTEIQKTLNEIPEDALKDVLSYLRDVKTHAPDKATIFKHIDRIIEEDHEVFKRLAE